MCILYMCVCIADNFSQSLTCLHAFHFCKLQREFIGLITEKSLGISNFRGGWVLELKRCYLDEFCFHVLSVHLSALAILPCGLFFFTVALRRTRLLSFWVEVSRRRE